MTTQFSCLYRINRDHNNLCELFSICAKKQTTEKRILAVKVPDELGSKFLYEFN